MEHASSFLVLYLLEGFLPIFFGFLPIFFVAFFFKFMEQIWKFSGIFMLLDVAIITMQKKRTTNKRPLNKTNASKKMAPVPKNQFENNDGLNVKVPRKN